MVVRELTGIYFGQPRVFFVTETGEKRGVNTMAYTEAEISRIGRGAFETARKRRVNSAQWIKQNWRRYLNCGAIAS